jgi:hypothetical protein
VASALRAAGVKIGQAEYDHVAVQTFVPRSAEAIAADVAELRSRVADALSWGESSTATSVAANLAFVRLVADERDGRVGALAYAKLLLDMQSIVAMRRRVRQHVAGVRHRATGRIGHGPPRSPSRERSLAARR